MTLIRRNMVLCLLATPLAGGVVYAADPAPVDQVVVEANRADLVKLAQQVLLAEERFYQRYNEINTKRKYAVKCSNEAETGTRFKKKTCKPVYESEAEAAEGREFMQALGRGAAAGSTSGGAVASSGAMGAGSSTGGGATGYGTGATQTSSTSNASISGGGTNASFIEIDSSRPEFQKNVLEVANKSPELQKLLKEHADAVRKYQDLYNRVNTEAPSADKAAAPAAASP